MLAWVRAQARQQTEREWSQATRGVPGAGVCGAQPMGQRPRRRNSSLSGNRTRGRIKHSLGFKRLDLWSWLIPSHPLEQVRNGSPKTAKPLTERMLQVQNRLDEEKKLVSSWREAVKSRGARETDSVGSCHEDGGAAGGDELS